MLILQGMTGSSVLDVFTSTLSVVFQVGIQLAFWVTLAFAILDRREVAASASDWTPEDLPEPVDRRITRGDTVVSVALLSVLIWAILWQQNHWLITLADGSEVPVLNPDLWSFWLPLALIVVVASIALEVVKYAVGALDRGPGSGQHGPQRGFRGDSAVAVEWRCTSEPGGGRDLA